MSRSAYRSNKPHFQGASITVQGLALIKDQRERTGAVFRFIPPEEQVRPGDDLSTLQKIALLQMMNSTLARGVAKRLASNEGVQGKPSIVDYHELRQRGFAEKLDGKQFHDLTYVGTQYAEQVLARLCADLDVHVIQPKQTTGEGRDARTYFRCSCGGWGRSLRGAGQFAMREAINQFHEHWNPMARGVEG